MSLIKCPECAREVSKKAISCPSCGAPISEPKRKTSFFTKMVAIFIALGVVLSIMGKVGADREADQKAEVEAQRIAALTPEQREAEQKAAAVRKAEEARIAELNNARYACQEFVRRSLNDPESADFEPHRSFWAEKTKDGAFDVQVHVRAKNAFGAKLKSVFECRARLDGDKWLPVKLRQMDT